MLETALPNAKQLQEIHFYGSPHFKPIKTAPIEKVGFYIQKVRSVPHKRKWITD